MKRKRLLSWLLTFAMIAGMFVAPVSAEGNTTTISGDGSEPKTGQMTITLKIKGTPTASDFAFTPPSKLSYDGQPKTASVTGKDGMGDITLDYYSGDTKLSGAPTADGTYTVKVSVTEGTDYKAASDITDASWTFTIAPYSTSMTITLAIAAASVTTAPTKKGNLKYNGSAQALVNAGEASNGEMQYALGENGTTAPATGWGTAIPTGTDAGNYYVWYRAASTHGNTEAVCVPVTIAADTHSMTITLTIKPTPATPNAPTAASTTKNSITLTTVIGCEYKLGDSAWQDSPAFSGLIPGTAYTFYQRVKETTDANASAVSPAATISTAADTYGMTITLVIKPAQTITASNVTVTYGDAGKSVSASTNGGGALSYAVKSGDAVTVNATTGALTIVKAGTATVTVTAAETATYGAATKDVTVTVNTKAMTVSAPNVTSTANGQPHGITVNVTDPTTGYTVKYGTEAGTYNLTASPTQTEAGTLTVYYQVTADNYTTYTGSATVTVSNKPAQTITASNITASYPYAAQV